MGTPANRFRRTALLGILLGASGLLCLGGGLALLAWRLLAPEDAVLLPPGVVITPEDTPTPGVLGRPLPAPPLPPDPAQVVILPESELPTPTATGTLPRVSPSPRPSDTPRPSATFTPAAILPTRTPAPARTRIAPTAIPPTVAPALTATPAPTATPSPTPTAPPPAVPDRILIDAIGLNAPVVPVGQHAVRLGGQVYSQWDVPNVFAAGWHQNSAPLGQPGNTVINGHHNIHGEVFRYLVALEPGDMITLEAAGQRHYYLVAQTMTLAEQGQPIDVRRENARWILPTRDERVTLITCWPYSANTHRLVVIAQPVWALGLPAELP